MEYIFIYLLQIVNDLEYLGKFVFIGFILSLIAYIISLCGTKFKGENFSKEDYVIYDTFDVNFGKNLSKTSKKCLITTLIILILLVLIPTKQTLVLMGSVYYGKMAAKQVITSEKIKKVNEVIDLQLDKVIKDLKNGSQRVSQP